MGHTVQGRLEDYWTKMEQLCCPFYGQMMVCARYYHILQFLHFMDNSRNEVDRAEDRLLKIWDLFEILRNFSKFYNPSEHLAVDEVIVKFRGRVVFKQYIPKKRKCFGIKMFKLRDCSRYTYDMNVYLGKDRQMAAQNWQQCTLHWLIWQGVLKELGHKLYMDTFFSSPDLFDNLAQENFPFVGLWGYIERSCPRTSDPRHWGWNMVTFK